MNTYHVSAKQLVLLALATAVFAASAVLFYDRTENWLLQRGANAEKNAAAGTDAQQQLAGLTDPSVASDEKNNQEVYRAMSPSVVNITSTTIVQDFFYAYPQQGSGSGSILDKEGHILTNYHVVQEAQKIDVSLPNGKSYKARVQGFDPDKDLAVLKIEAPAAELAPIPLGTSKELFVGQKVLAIGNPFGLDRTLTTGIVSGLSRPIRSEMTNRLIEGVIQTDAAINPGNSGGPLLDSHGRQIGINTMIYSPSGGSVGIGFAVPIEAAKKIIPDILAYGRVRKPKFGIAAYPVSGRLAEALELPVQEGLLVMQVEPGSSAARAGIQGGSERAQLGRQIILIGGDVITGIDGQPIKNSDDLDRAIGDKNLGDVVKVELWRSGRKQQLSVTLAEAPSAARRGL
ncbi:MAG: trypsin-like peptidase domain-containing protein [Acidobacteria bacterium]|nr:trypsin-like peptidase domain-containing protein [Acidobacteriota bacterium]MBI3427706.1 trypsin-like peptidase domain-containing protein [Acidobacteriota bacterium]